MTQAFNLSQLANKVNTSGQLDASTGLVNITPVANGGTGRSSVTTGRLLVGAGTSAMTLLAGTNVNDGVIWNGTSWVSGSLATNPPVAVTFVAPGTWTKPAVLAGIKVTVVGGGGNGGAGGSSLFPSQSYSGGAGGGGGTSIRWIPAPSIPGPVAITAGSGTNSFGAFASATGGGNGTNSPNGTPGTPGNGGSGSGGTINLSGQSGSGNLSFNAPVSLAGYVGGDSSLGFGGNTATSKNGIAYGGGAAGGYSTNPGGGIPGGTGASGIIIVEEFY